LPQVSLDPPRRNSQRKYQVTLRPLPPRCQRISRRWRRIHPEDDQLIDQRQHFCNLEPLLIERYGLPKLISVTKSMVSWLATPASSLTLVLLDRLLASRTI
jgi:hypothetical protein